MMIIELRKNLTKQDVLFVSALDRQEIESKLYHVPAELIDQLTQIQLQAKSNSYKEVWPLAETFIIVFKNQNAGKVIMQNNIESIQIIDLIIIKELRNKGIGNALLSQLKSNAQLKNKKLINLTVAKGNPAINLYLRCGFLVKKESDSQVYMSLQCT